MLTMCARIVVFIAMAASAYSQAAAFQWMQQMGGSRGQSIAGMTTDPWGNIYVVGNTSSIDFPTKSAFQSHPGGSGLYRIDGPGAQWQNLYGAGFTSVTSLSVDPQDVNTIYAVSLQGLYRSADAGATWTALRSFDVRVAAVAVDPSASHVLYVATRGQGVFKSSDGGATWTAINNGIPPAKDDTLQAYNIWVDPLQPAVVFASTFAGLARSSDGGATWHTDSQFSFDPEYMDMALDPNTPGLIYLATASGLRKSTDDGVTWTPIAPPIPYGLGALVLADPRHAGTLYLAGSGLWVSTDGGNSWTDRSRQYLPRTGPLAADPVTGALYVVASAGEKMLMSNDGFATATVVGPVAVGITSLVAAGGRAFAGTQNGSDVFVAKFDPQGNPIYSTYFGGASSDLALAMAVDADGSVYVTGATSSVDFPVSPNAYAKTGNTFVFKLNADGSLGYSTYFSSARTRPYAIAVDGGGHAYIAGLTGGDLPVTAGAYQTTLQGSSPCNKPFGPCPPPVTNAFLTEFDPGGASLVFSTYIGSLNAFAQALALAPDGNAILAGAGSLYRMKGDGSALLNSGKLPGVVWALTVNDAGDIYAGGLAYSNINPPFPTTPGAFQAAPYFVPSLPGGPANSSGHGFVTKLDSQFNILASTLLGGESRDETLALAIAANGNIIAGGSTYSKAFPLRGAAQGSFSSATGFVTELTPDLSSVVVSTFVGDTRMFYVGAVAPAADGGLLFAGITASAPSYSDGTFVFSYLVFWSPSIQGVVGKIGIDAASPRVDAAVNAASQLGVPLTPGGVFQVHGDGFGSDATLLVNGNSLPLISQSRTALTATLPEDFSAQAAQIVVKSAGGQSNAFLAPVAAAAPGLYSVDGSGVGQGYILNQDGSLNSPSNPAKEGATVTICATGVGPLTFDAGYAVAASPVNVYIDGFHAIGIAAILGPAAGLPGDVYQISVYVPRPSDNLPGFVMPPSVAVTLQVNGATSQAGLALSVSH